MMKKITKMLVLALALVAAFSLGAGSTAEAAKKKKVTVKKVTSVDKLTGKKSITLAKGKTATLKTTVTVTPNKSANKKVKYKSSNSKVASVTSKGKITAKKAGSAKITVTSTKNSKKKATVKVKVVTGKVKSIKVTATAKTIKVGQKTKVKATIKTTGKKPNKSVVWSSSNEAVATVDKNGNVTAKKAGSAKITGKTTDGTNKKSYVTVNVQGYTVTAKDGQKVDATVEFVSADLAKVQADLDAVAKMAADPNASFTVTLDDNAYVAKVVNGQVQINGKPLAASVKAQGKTSVKVSVNVKSEKVAALIAVVPTSVKSVTVSGVAFTEFGNGTVKVNGTAVGYSVNGKTINIDSADGDVQAVVTALAPVATVQ